jgi:hypothetical protein
MTSALYFTKQDLQRLGVLEKVEAIFGEAHENGRFALTFDQAYELGIVSASGSSVGGVSVRLETEDDSKISPKSSAAGVPRTPVPIRHITPFIEDARSAAYPPLFTYTQGQIRGMRAKFGMHLQSTVLTTPVNLTGEQHIKCMREEVTEFEDALKLEDPIEQAIDMLDALCDLQVFAEHCAFDYGLARLFNYAYCMVNRSNLSKGDDTTGEHFEPSGKLKKGPEFFKPDLAILFSGKVSIAWRAFPELEEREAIAFRNSITKRVGELTGAEITVPHPAIDEIKDMLVLSCEEERLSFFAKLCGLSGVWEVGGSQVMVEVHPVK